MFEPTPTPSNDGRKRVTLTAKQAAEGFGKALCEVANNLLADGKLTKEEVAAMSQWLDTCEDPGLSAFTYLREEMQRYAADGIIHAWELGRLQMALERILPASDRAIAKEARKKAETEAAARDEAATESERESERLNFEKRQAVQKSEKPTEAQLKFIADLGGSLPLNATKQNASELIGQLLAERDEAEPAPSKPVRTKGKADDTALHKAIAAHKPAGAKWTIDARIPARQPYEGRATLKQKDLLWSLGFKDQAILDSLGKWQASALIDQIKTKQNSGCGGAVGLLIIIVGTVILVGLNVKSSW